jgi:putative membrane protein
MHTQKKVLNPQVFLELISYMAFAVLMLYLVSTGKYQWYVTPRMVPYFYFTSAVMVIWALGGLFRLFRPQHRTRAAHCLVLAIPVILLLLPHTAIGTTGYSSGFSSGKAFASLAEKSSNNTIKGGGSASVPTGDSSVDNVDIEAADTLADDQSINNVDIEETGSSTDDPSVDVNTDTTDTVDIAAAYTSEEDQPTESTVAASSETAVSDLQTETQSDTGEEEAIADLPGLNEKNKRITVSNDDFSFWLATLYEDMEKYKGYTISMTGFVFRDPEIMAKNEFVPARLMMSCCAADLSPAGVFCEYDKAAGLTENSWVTVEGTLIIGQYEYEGEKYDEPRIAVTKITPASKVEDYVYP